MRSEARFGRRAVVLAGAGLLAAGARASLATPSRQTVRGDCMDEPGIEFMAEYLLGLPVVSPADLTPRADWLLYLSPDPQSPLTFLHPPGWQAATLWADQVGPDAEPAWGGQRSLAPALTSHRLVAADGSAVFEAVFGTLFGALLSPLELASIARASLLGAGMPTEPVCDYENRATPPLGWFEGLRAGQSGELTMTSHGWITQNPSAFVPSTIVGWYGMAGPREAYIPLLRGAWLPILQQLSGGGGSTPTPTPTPGWGG